MGLDFMENLKKDKEKNASIINFFSNYPPITYYEIGNSVLVKGKSDKIWVYISSDDRDELIKLMKKVNFKDKNFAAIDDWMMPIIAKNKNILWQLRCYKLYFPEDKDVCSESSDLKTINSEDAEYIFKYYDYGEYTDINYIKERIKNGISLGKYSDGKLIGWILTQDDGAMGFLHVLKDFRNQGVATELTYEMIKKIKNKGKIPFVHIEVNNKKSLNLAKKMGFKLDGIKNWFEVE